MSGLYRAARLAKCSSHTGRRTFANRLLSKGHDPEKIQQLLGHADLDHTDAYFDVKSEMLEAMFAGALWESIITVMKMTPQQFDLLAQLLRSKEPVTTGARLVLLHGVPNAEAARTAGATPQSVHRAAKRFDELHGEILTTYKKALASSAGR